jgi:beta-phosphoglucomutase-like phosphatase (HAD superfamily)
MPCSMARFQLVIFDCDGVLVDSERITNQVFADLLGELGLVFSLIDCVRPALITCSIA